MNTEHLEPRFDPARSQAIEQLLTDTVEATPPRSAQPLRARRTFFRTRTSRGLAAAGGALVLFAGGLVVGAAAYATTPNAAPLPSATPGAPSGTAFTIDCYTGANPNHVLDSLDFGKYNDPTGLLLAAARANPAQICQEQRTVDAQNQVYSGVIKQNLVSGAQQCAVITIPGAGAFYTWVSSNELNGTSEPFWVREPAKADLRGYVGDYSKPAGYPTNCPHVTAPFTPPAPLSVAACFINNQRTAVIPLGAAAPAEACRSRGYSVWDN